MVSNAEVSDMANPSIKKQILHDLDQLSPQMQERAMHLVHSLVAELPKGASGADLMTLAGTLDADSAREMREAIAEGCEQIDPDAW